MEKYVTASFSITPEQVVKIMKLAKENDVSASKLIRKEIDKMPKPKRSQSTRD